MEILFLHLSDMHIRNEKDISDFHIQKIVESLNTYKTDLKNIVLILSGDLTYEGKKVQFENVRKIVGTLIKKCATSFQGSRLCILAVPGNHDVMHDGKPLSVDVLKGNDFSEIESSENKKLEHFYNFAKLNKCFENNQIYIHKKSLNINGFTIQANLINNAIFSTIDEYKGLLYLPTLWIDQCKDINADFTITVMHHSPDFYQDKTKNIIEKDIVGKSSVLFYGHEHNNVYRRVSYNGSRNVIVQSGGCLCENGNWNSGSYRVGILDTKTGAYEYQKFAWNNESKQYEHNVPTTEILEAESQLPINNEFYELIYDNDYKKGYYVFPKVLQHINATDEPKQFESFDAFLKEVLEYQKVIITGTSNIGKSTLLKKMFEELSKRYTVLFCSPDILLTKSNNKKQNMSKLIKEIFRDIYGESESDWQKFTQLDRRKCIFIFDDFDQIDGINITNFMQKLSDYCGTVILTSTQTIDFTKEAIISDHDKVARFEIKPPLGSKKRKEIIEAVALKNADDKSVESIANIVNQIDKIIKTQLEIVPPEPYFIVLVAENFIRSVGEVAGSSTNAFSKVFEANITSKIDIAIKKVKKGITVDLMYLLLGKIGYYIHFNKTYPITRTEVDKIIKDYNSEYGNNIVTEDFLTIAKKSKIIIVSKENSETFRFGNKSMLAYFVAKEIIGRYRDTKDITDIEKIISMACFNICTDILLFMIFQTDDISIIYNMLNSVQKMTETDGMTEFSVPKAMPKYLENFAGIDDKSNVIERQKEREQLQKVEEKSEELMVNEFEIRDIYDWDDIEIERFINKLNRMTALLHIVSKALPCFEHRLKKAEKMRMVETLYRLPNMIFMYWAKSIDENFDAVISESLPYFESNNKFKRLPELEKDKKMREFFSLHSLNILLNLYYIPVMCATGKNTDKYLVSKEFFDYSSEPTHRLEHLMMLEQMTNDEFIKESLKLNENYKNPIPNLLLRRIVRHGIISRDDKREDVQRLEEKFFSPQAKPRLLIEKTKAKNSKG